MAQFQTLIKWFFCVFLALIEGSLFDNADGKQCVIKLFECCVCIYFLKGHEKLHMKINLDFVSDFSKKKDLKKKFFFEKNFFFRKKFFF